MDIADIIAAIQRGINPDQAILNANGAIPPAQPGPQASAPVPPQPIPAASGTPVGVATPVTNPQPPNATTSVTQSPPDLANMYIELMKKNQNAQQMDSGLNLIAAGFSNSPATRAALINASAAGGHGGMTLSASDMINFQKQQQAVQDKLIRQQALPALMKQCHVILLHKCKLCPHL
jgi:hypothetical protein